MLLIIPKYIASAKYFWRPWYFFVFLFPRQFCLTLHHLDPISISYLLENSACYFSRLSLEPPTIHFPSQSFLISKKECFLLFRLKSFCFRVKKMKTQLALTHISFQPLPRHVHCLPKAKTLKPLLVFMFHLETIL